MKIVKLKAGFGNQLFQYAFLKYLEKESKVDCYLDFNWLDIWFSNKNRHYEDIINIDLLNVTYSKINETGLKKIVYKLNKFHPRTKRYKLYLIVQGLLNPKYYFKRNHEFENYSVLSKYSYYDGYWQSWKYAEEVRNQLLSDFSCKNKLRKPIVDFIEKIVSYNSVFIGIRLGDYGNRVDHFGEFKDDYYNEAAKIIMQRVENPIFYVFSNRINEVKENFKFDFNVVFIERNLGFSDFEEFVIMSSCKHAIIPNSTFHWWAAWLIKNEEKVVVAPKKWFADNTKIDIVHPKWIKL